VRGLEILFEFHLLLIQLMRSRLALIF